MPKNAKPKSCPAYVSFHGAGVGSSNMNAAKALQGFIALDINAHGIENGHPRKYYNDLRENFYLPKGKPGYPQWGKESRDTFYFKGMYMRVLRALEYVKSLPQWDGKRLVVSGSSQGGAQVLAACGLDKDVTFARCEVPAMCDHAGCLVGHQSGWPRLFNVTKDGKSNNPAAEKCASYFDGVHFAKRVKCPIYFSTGGYDFTCCPSSVYKAYNNVPAGVVKSIYFNPTGNHGGSKIANFESVLKKYIKE
jgi:cephalosporin-C deacetylase-like acetyl esterase